MKICEIVRTNIKIRREELKLSQSTLAAKTDLSKGMIAGIEVGSVMPSMESLARIATALKLKPYQLLLEEEDKKPFNRQQVYREVAELLQQEAYRLETVIRDRLRLYDCE